MTLKRIMQVFKADIVREDGRLERTCEHGIGHPVGHVDWRRLQDDHMWVHGCDGCCRGWKQQEVGMRRIKE